MARIPGSNGEKTLQSIYDAAIDLIYQDGYEAVSLRQLAGAVGIQAGSLYNHIASKQDLLYKLILTIMEDLNKDLDKELEHSADADDALRRFVKFHISYYAARKKKVFICNFELRSLQAENYKQIVGLRDQYEQRLVSILTQGISDGLWKPADVGVAAKALIAMLTGICVWYDPNGGYSIDELVEHYSELVFRGINRL